MPTYNAGLTHNGANMRRAWDAINALFSNHVLQYLVAEAERISAAAASGPPAAKAMRPPPVARESAATTGPGAALPASLRTTGTGGNVEGSESATAARLPQSGGTAARLYPAPGNGGPVTSVQLRQGGNPAGAGGAGKGMTSGMYPDV
jgi:hypothetical protein